MTFALDPTFEAIGLAGLVLMNAAHAWRGLYTEAEEDPREARSYCTGPCGRVDATVGGVEIVARVVAPGRATLLRAYAPMPEAGCVQVRRRRAIER